MKRIVIGMQLANENDCIRAEGARKRQEYAEEVQAAFSQLSERLDQQSENVTATQQENEDLRAQLSKINEVLTLSDEIRKKYEEECHRLSGEAQAQVWILLPICYYELVTLYIAHVEPQP